MTHEFDAQQKMTRALRVVCDLTQRADRIAAYRAAGVDPGDHARLDRYALHAETERRRLFPLKFPPSPPAGLLADAGALTL